MVRVIRQRETARMIQRFFQPWRHRLHPRHRHGGGVVLGVVLPAPRRDHVPLSVGPAVRGHGGLRRHRGDGVPGDGSLSRYLALCLHRGSGRHLQGVEPRRPGVRRRDVRLDPAGRLAALGAADQLVRVDGVARRAAVSLPVVQGPAGRFAPVGRGPHPGAGAPGRQRRRGRAVHPRRSAVRRTPITGWSARSPSAPGGSAG